MLASANCITQPSGAKSGNHSINPMFINRHPLCRNIKNNLMFADKREKNKELSSRWKEQKKEHRTSYLSIKNKEQNSVLGYCHPMPFYL